MADSIFPFIDATVADAAPPAALSPPKEYDWDFDKNAVVLTNGRTTAVTGTDALKVWTKKALSTQRYRFLAYTWIYGQEFDSLIGQQMSPEVTQSEAQRYLTEALTVNPHIQGVKDVTIEVDGSRVTVNFTEITDQGEVSISV